MDSLLDKGRKINIYFPQIKEKILIEASFVYNGLLILPGTERKRVFVGIPSKWLDNPVGNYEYTYSLSRMYHLKTLSEAYLVSGDIKYIKRVKEELEDFIDTVPAPQIDLSDISIFSKCTPWRALEVGSRGINTWPLIISALKESALYDEALKQKVETSAKVHMEILYNVSPLLWPKADHNHYLIENMGLLSFSSIFPNLDKDEKYKKHALKELARCFEMQTTEDGGQIEGSPSYHNACLYWFSFYSALTEKKDKLFIEKINKMFSYSIYSSRNNGGLIPLGDSHSKDKETIMHPALLLYFFTSDTQYLKDALFFSDKKTLDEELISNIFLFDDLDKLYSDYQKVLKDKKEAPKLPLYSYQEKLGQVFIRSGFNKKDLSLALICKSPVQNRHSHIDPGSIDFEAFGKVLIVDPGIYTYKEGKDRYNFKSTLYHSTVSVDKKDAWPYLGSFKYGEMKESRITNTYFSASLSYASMKIDTYSPVKIKRLVALLNNEAVLVIDDFKNAKNKTIDSSFNINSLTLKKEKNAIFTEDDDVNLLILTNCKNALFEKGEYSERLDEKKESTILRLNRKNTESFINTTLLIPYEGKYKPTIHYSFSKKDTEVEITFKEIKYIYKDGELNVKHS